MSVLLPPSPGKTTRAMSSEVDPLPGFGMGPTAQLTVSQSDSSGDSSTFGDGLGAGDTHVSSDSSTFRQSSYQAGSFAGGSFSFSSVVFSSAATDSSTSTDSDSSTSTDSSSQSDSHSDAHTGANASDSSSDQGSTSYGSQDTVTLSDSGTNSSRQTMTLYEAGSFAGGSYALSSYSLVHQVSETRLLSDAGAGASLLSGSNWEDDVVDCYTSYDGGDSFSDSSSSAQTMSETMTDGFTLSEQGSFAGGSFSLASYLFSQNESFSESMTESDSLTDSFSGTNQGQSYSGGGGGSGGEQEVSNGNGSMTEQGSWSGGSFALGSMTYQGDVQGDGDDGGCHVLVSSGQRQRGGRCPFSVPCRCSGRTLDRRFRQFLEADDAPEAVHRDVADGPPHALDVAAVPFEPALGHRDLDHHNVLDPPAVACDRVQGRPFAPSRGVEPHGLEATAAFAGQEAVPQDADEVAEWRGVAKGDGLATP